MEQINHLPYNKEEYYKRIVYYYEESEITYREGWDLKHSMALHGGYWDEKATTFRKALLRLNEVMAEMAGIQKDMYVLDAGCGVGGSSIFLANEYRCKVLGISLVDRQLFLARENAKKKKVAPHLIDFQNMDYTATGLPSNTFDVVWAIESVCHSYEKMDFIKEAYRILKPGGQLILIDYFMQRSPKDSKEADDYQFFLDTFYCYNLADPPTFGRKLAEAGFKDIQELDKTPNYMPNLKRFVILGRISLAITNFLGFFGIERKNKIKVKTGRTTLICTDLFRKGLLKFYLFKATK